MEKYGFTVKSGGLTTYDGGMVSKAGVSNANCTYDSSDSSKLTKLTYTYCGHTLSADITWNGDDISSVDVSEVTEVSE